VQILRKILGKVLRLFLPQRWMRILRDPVLLPGYYRKFAQDIEPLIDMAQNGWNKDPEYLMAMLRKYAHIIDKALERPDYEPGHSRQWYDAAKTTLNLLEKNYASDPTITWVKEKIQEYEKRQCHPEHTEKYGHIYSSEEDYHTLMRIIKERRSIRNFTDQPVEIEKINRFLEAINWAPSSCNSNRQKCLLQQNLSLLNNVPVHAQAQHALLVVRVLYRSAQICAYIIYRKNTTCQILILGWLSKMAYSLLIH